MKEIAELQTLALHEERKKAIVLLHGYGADANDLAPLSEMVPTPEPFSWYFPNGPVEIPINPWMKGRAWFHLDMTWLDQGTQRGFFDDFSDSISSGFLEITGKIQNLIQELEKNHEEVILGGFSQGSLVATDVTLLGNSRTRILIALSSALACQKRWESALEQRKSLRVFQSHGKQDPVLPYSSAEELGKIYAKHLNIAEFHGFDGGHEIPASILNKFSEFLKKNC